MIICSTEEVGKVLFLDQVLYNYRIGTGENISLGQNGDKAFMWHIVGIIDACRRRCLPIEDIVSKDWDDYLAWNREDARIDGIESIKKSLSYRIGNILIKPFMHIILKWQDTLQKLLTTVFRNRWKIIFYKLSVICKL